MRVLFTNWHYSMMGGAQTWVHTLAKALAEMGHQPLVWSDGLGLIAGKTSPFARCSTSLDALAPWDIVWGSHQITGRVPPHTPRCQIIHATQNQDQEAPVAGLDAYFAVSEEVERFLEDRGVACAGIVRQPIDTERFRSLEPARPWPPRVLHFGNYQRWVPLAAEACRRLGLPFAVCGGPTDSEGRRWDVERALNEADLVIGQTRCALEAMACERNAIVCSGWDPDLGYGLDGFVTPDNYTALRVTNFTGNVSRSIPTVEALVGELRRYDPALGPALRSLVVAHHHPSVAAGPLLDWSRSALAVSPRVVSMNGTRVLVYQVCYDEASEAQVDPQWTPYRNDTVGPFFESKVIADLLAAGHHRAADYFGVFSWKFGAKIPLSPRAILARMEQDGFRADVYSFFGRIKERQLWRVAEQKHPGILQAATLLMQRLNLDADLSRLEAPIIYQNHFICRSRIYEQFERELLAPALRAMADPADTALQALIGRDADYADARVSPAQLVNIFGRPHFTLQPFICERLFSTWLGLNPAIRVRHIWRGRFVEIRNVQDEREMRLGMRSRSRGRGSIPFNLCRMAKDGYEHGAALDDVAEILCRGIEGLGHPVRLLYNSFGDDGVNIVLSAHLLDRARAGLLSPDTIVYNVEQIDEGSGWLRSGLLVALERCVVWDYSRRNLERIRALTRNTRLAHVPLGYVPQLTRVATDGPLDIDVLFYGSLNPRRAHVIDALRARGLRVETAFGLYGSARDALIARAKVVLNVHYYEARILETARVGYLLANRKAVVAECNEGTEIPPELSDAVRLAPYDEIVSACEELVADDERRRHFEETGFQQVRSHPATALMREAVGAAAAAEAAARASVRLEVRQTSGTRRP